MLETLSPQNISLQTAPRRRTLHLSRADVLVGLLLVLVMTVGAYFRFTGLNYDDYVRFHPDERFLTLNVGLQIGRDSLSFTDGDEAQQREYCLQQYPDTNGVGGYYDARCSTMNPHNIGNGFYAYGTLPLFVAKWTGDLLDDLTNTTDYTGYNSFHLTWRTLSALYDTIAILLVFLTGMKLYGRWAGLLAAAIYAGLVLPIQIAHFATTDGMTSMWVTATIFFVVRTQKDGGWLNWAGCGAAFGAALASRFNVLPLVVPIIAVAAIRGIPGFDGRLPWSERQRVLLGAFAGLVLAGFMTVLVFRVFNPYAFVGPGFFGILPNERWIDDLRDAQAGTSPQSDAPPQWQWVGRVPYLYAWQNMVLWGMGIAAGLTGWVAFLVALWRLVRGKMGALQNAPLVIWVLVYFAFIGGNFVMSMRYYLPLYSTLTLLAVWLLMSLIRGAPRAGWRRGLAIGFAGLVAGFTLLWGLMFTNIYRHQATYVQASQWVWERIPGDFAMQIEGAPETVPLINIPLPNPSDAENSPTTNATLLLPAEGASYDVTQTVNFTAPADGVVRTVHAPHIGAGNMMRITVRPPGAPPGQELAQVVIDDLHARTVSDEPLPTTLPVERPFQVFPGQTYEVVFEVLHGGNVQVVEGTFGLVLDEGNSGLPPMPLTLPADTIPAAPDASSTVSTPMVVTINAINAGVVTNLQLPALRLVENPPSTLNIEITRPGETEPLAAATLTEDFAREGNVIGQSYDIPLDRPLEVQAGQEYEFRVSVEAGKPLITSGGLLAWEGVWDEPMPATVCTLPWDVTLADDPPPGLLSDEECRGRNPRGAARGEGLINDFMLNLYRDELGEGGEEKRRDMVQILDNADYLMIGTNRRYDSQSRIPLRWTLTNTYYDALFNGELGYELVEVFQETFELGPIKVSEQHLPIYDSPAWLNEFEAEEAFSVYDHPVVFVFQKRDDYSPQAVRDILYSVPLSSSNALFGGRYNSPQLVGGTHWSVEQAQAAPTALMFTDAMYTIQSQGGTWSERFDRESPINVNPVVTVAAWYALLLVLGWAVFPVLFPLLPGLPDRGYGFARFMGMFVVAWLAYTLGTMRFVVWSAAGLWVITGGLAILSLVIAVRNRAKLLAFIRERWRLLLTIEALTLVLFGAMLLVRLSNPDLWDRAYGGEKPMDFSMFNGVLRSTIFPAIDPWFSGGYINYYYFGYVITGVPTLMLGVVPSIAYNLLLPTLYATIGAGVFSATFAVVWWWRARSVHYVRMGSPYVAGVAAVILALVLGNLDTPRIFAVEGLAQIGGYQRSEGLQDYLQDQYRAENNLDPVTPIDPAALAEISLRAEENRLTDRIPYELAEVTSRSFAVLSGVARLVSGEVENFPVDANRWFWAPTRIIQEIPEVRDNAIHEMPAFTFIYGDMHAHMISMTLMLFAIAFVFNELAMAGREQRRFTARFGAIAMGALAVGMLRPTNTWDFPTFMLLCVLGLGYAWWLSWRTINRRSLLSMFGRIGGFIVLAFAVALPYTSWFYTSYSAVTLWEGPNTPLWAFLQIHGLFLFLVFSLLVWETARWLNAVQVRALRGRGRFLAIAAGVIGLMLLGTLIAAMREYQVALVTLPLVVWIVVLFFRPGQSVPMQYTLVLAGLALSITLGTEFIVLSGDSGRQNTVFKFYIQVWLLFSVAGGAIVAWLLRDAEAWGGRIRTVWYGVGAVLLFAAALFPIMATFGRAVYRLAPNTPITLDGAQFMNYITTDTSQPGANLYVEADVTDNLQTVDMAADYAAITWLQENVQGSPTIMEAQSKGGSLYQWGGRIAIHTGLPSVIGWDYHQRQQRPFEGLDGFITARGANVNAFYTTRDLAAAWRILDYYNVQYVVVAGLERARYEVSGGLAKFAEMVERGWLTPVFSEDGATIYAVNHEVDTGIRIADAAEPMTIIDLSEETGTGDIQIGE